MRSSSAQVIEVRMLADNRQENDLVLFRNRGLMHSVVGHFTEDQVRVFHQCNLAASDEPVGPDAEDIKKWA